MSRLGIGGTVKDFVIQKFLGQGSFGAVYKVKRKSDGKIYAMKQVNTRKMSQKDREVAVNEIRILASTKNQYIIKFYEAFVHDQMLYIITEYAANGDVFQRLKRMKQKRQSIPKMSCGSSSFSCALGFRPFTATTYCTVI